MAQSHVLQLSDHQSDIKHPSQVFQLSDHERTTSSSTHGCPWPPQWMRNISKAWLSTVVFIKYTPNANPPNIITHSLSNIYRWQNEQLLLKFFGGPGKTSADKLAASKQIPCFFIFKKFDIWEWQHQLYVTLLHIRDCTRPLLFFIFMQAKTAVSK